MPAPPSPVLVKAHDLLLWLLPATAKFPKTLRHTLTNRIECAALDLEAALLRANRLRGERRLAALDDADALLDALRMFLRLATELQCLTGRQYEFAAGKTTEIGRLIGGWRKATSGAAPSGGTPRPT